MPRKNGTLSQQQMMANQNMNRVLTQTKKARKSNKASEATKVTTQKPIESSFEL